MRISLKANPTLSNGISRVKDDIDYTIARACVAETWRLMAVEGSIIWKNLGSERKGWCVWVGGFKNGLKLELDETDFGFGISYEIEELIEMLLMDNGIRYSYSEASKFAVSPMGKLPRVTEH